MQRSQVRGGHRYQGNREGRKVFPEGNLVKLQDFRPRGQIYVSKAAKDHTRRYSLRPPGFVGFKCVMVTRSLYMQLQEGCDRQGRKKR